MSLENISHIYKGLLLRNRAFASFRQDELETIFDNIVNSNLPEGSEILDPMSGYGGGMSYFGSKGYSTYNIELNPPSHFWQLLINPANSQPILTAVEQLLNIKKWPLIKDAYSLTDELFSETAISHIKKMYAKIFSITNDRTLAIAILLPFVARFANYQRNDTNFTHCKQGGICSFVDWENDFTEYLIALRNKVNEQNIPGQNHTNILCNFLDFETNKRFKCFVTSPPYPNYRDYSKIFKIENWTLKNIFDEDQSGLQNMIGSDIIKGKAFGEISSKKAQDFLHKLFEKSKKLTKKSKYDIDIYYYPYFSLYFYQIQQAYIKLDQMLSSDAFGYIVVNNNITRDIEVPVGESIIDIFTSLGFEHSIIDESEISHLGNLRKQAKRINARHIRYIVKVWKK